MKLLYADHLDYPYLLASYQFSNEELYQINWCVNIYLIGDCSEIWHICKAITDREMWDNFTDIREKNAKGFNFKSNVYSAICKCLIELGV